MTLKHCEYIGCTNQGLKRINTVVVCDRHELEARLNLVFLLPWNEAPTESRLYQPGARRAA